MNEMLFSEKHFFNDGNISCTCMLDTVCRERITGIINAKGNFSIAPETEVGKRFLKEVYALAEKRRRKLLPHESNEDAFLIETIKKHGSEDIGYTLYLIANKDDTSWKYFVPLGNKTTGNFSCWDSSVASSEEVVKKLYEFVLNEMETGYEKQFLLEEDIEIMKNTYPL